MMKLEQSSSFARQLNSYQSPKHSRWLQSSLQELDGKLKAMLKLIEADADSFAQRAEMYYKKRPELVNMVDEFDRAYKHLAERYDHLMGEIQQNIPKVLQAQYGLTCDSPRGSAFGRSTFRRDQQGFEKLLKKFEAGQLDELSQSEDLDAADASGSDTKENGLSQEEQTLSSSDSEIDDSTESDKLQQILCNLEQENKKLTYHCHSTEEENEALQIRVKDLEEQVSILQEETLKLADKRLAGSEENTPSETKVKELEEELLRLQEENAKLVEDTLQRSARLKEVEDEVCALREEKVVLEEEIFEDRNEVNGLQNAIELLQAIALDRAEQVRTFEDTVKQLQGENHRLADEVSAAVERGKIAMTALKFMKGEVSSLAQSNKKLRNEILDQTTDETLKVKEISSLQEENKGLTSKLQDFRAAEEKRVSDLNSKIKDLHRQLTFLSEENKKQKLVLLDRAEEKREAIRQLCFSIDVLKEKNQRLEEALCSAKMRLNGFRNSSSSYHLPTWKKFFLGAWNVPKSQPCALAL